MRILRIFVRIFVQYLRPFFVSFHIIPYRTLSCVPQFPLQYLKVLTPCQY